MKKIRSFTCIILITSLFHLISPANCAEKLHFLITDYGARSGRDILCTQAFEQAIEQAAINGGVVVVPKGEFRSGAIFLKPGVDLCIEKDATLIGSDNIDDFPVRMTHIEGQDQLWRTALINADNVDNLHIYGQGTINGDGLIYWQAFWQRRAENKDCTNLEVHRPRMFYINNSDNILIENLTLKDSGFWTLHIFKCDFATIRNLNISSQFEPVPAPSTDGIDIDSCRNVTVSNCQISVNDDCIAIKCGKGPNADTNPINTPVENILVENCTFGRGHGMVTIGSEATLVRNIIVRNCTVLEGNRIVRLKLRPDTPQRYENIIFENIRADNAVALFDVKPWTQFYDVKGQEPPASFVNNLILRNCDITCQTIGDLRGNPGDVISNVKIINSKITATYNRFNIGTIDGLIYDNVIINDKTTHAPQLDEKDWQTGKG
ncbi:MAG: right-handed parallel beta-helix repeat-containing protein [Sedimentisphaerales bacterium]|nr:right-handed parallel beta-helix repeat-containing protein [Sedimentisphaerales bacterium]MBN2843187.1 right-handed parallel beta-helix repeat-containing protein [Sedimentisphaerales bacterium]